MYLKPACRVKQTTRVIISSNEMQLIPSVTSSASLCSHYPLPSVYPMPSHRISLLCAFTTTLGLRKYLNYDCFIIYVNMREFPLYPTA